MCSFLPHVLRVDQDVRGQFALDTQAPTLLVGRPVRCCGAKRAIGAKPDIIHQAQLISRGLNQSIWKRIAQVQVRRCTIALVGRNHVGVLVEALATVGHDAGDTRARLPVVHTVAAADDHLRSKLISEAETRLEIMPVRHVIRALAGRSENFSATQLQSRGPIELVSVRELPPLSGLCTFVSNQFCRL